MPAHMYHMLQNNHQQPHHIHTPSPKIHTRLASSLPSITNHHHQQHHHIHTPSTSNKHTLLAHHMLPRFCNHGARHYLTRQMSINSTVVSHYDVLGVERDATAQEIKHAFRQKAKELHPDLANKLSTADGVAFLRLVEAYEVLQDPQQRQLYDVASHPGMPGLLRSAASKAAAAAAAHSSPGTDLKAATLDTADPSCWRWGLGCWAQQRLAPDAVAKQDDTTRFRLMAALHKYQQEFEDDLHAGLMKAFLGPKLDILPGQLPPAFEADERAHPTLSADLLHLVHGRTLLGVVRERQPLRLTASAPRSCIGSGGVWPTPLPAPAGTCTATASRAAGHVSCSSGVSNSSGCSSGQTEVIDDAEWAALLQEQHPLKLSYDWTPPARPTEPETGNRTSPHLSIGTAEPAALGMACDCISAPTKVPDPDCSSSTTDGTQVAEAAGQQPQQWISHGGRMAFKAWQEQQQQVSACMKTPDASNQHSAQDAGPARGHLWQGQQQKQQQQQPEQDSWWQQLPHFELLKQEQQNQSAKRQDSSRQRQYEQQQQWLRRRRLRRWVQIPSADWCAADWTFDDAVDGVLVLELLLGSHVSAVAVQDNKQPARPIKVYVNGVFAAAVLDDIVMEPLTGRLLAVLYRYYTPGVHHAYFYQPYVPQSGMTGSSRVLARCQRRWMPPSSTWLFPARSEQHDTGGWLVEWEGYTASERFGWLHPATYVLTCACYSVDLEQRRLAHANKRQQLWRQLIAGPAGKLLLMLKGWLV